MNLKYLAVKHPFHCETENYFNNEANQEWGEMSDFLDEFENSDVDMNLIFRWDVYVNDNGSYSAEIFMIHQRKGFFAPHIINKVDENDIERLLKYLKRHKKTIDELWDLI